MVPQQLLGLWQPKTCQNQPETKPKTNSLYWNIAKFTNALIVVFEIEGKIVAKKIAQLSPYLWAVFIKKRIKNVFWAETFSFLSKIAINNNKTQCNTSVRLLFAHLDLL